MDKEQFFGKVREFIVSRSKIPDAVINKNTPLVESGIVDSLLITELIVFIEDLLNTNVDIDTFRLDSFYSIETIYDSYAPAVKR